VQYLDPKAHFPGFECSVTAVKEAYAKSSCVHAQLVLAFQEFLPRLNNWAECYDSLEQLMSSKSASSINTAASNHKRLLNQLIVAKSASIQPADGRLQVALAVASVTSLVTVNASAVPFTTIPQYLFDLTFDDNTVGISEGQMPAFYAALTVLLPTITADIQQVETTTNDNPSIGIEQIAQYVRLSLVTAQGAS
jgi:hypothetical protein